jgi:hypothetical protein
LPLLSHYAPATHYSPSPTGTPVYSPPSVKEQIPGSQSCDIHWI